MEFKQGIGKINNQSRWWGEDRENPRDEPPVWTSPRLGPDQEVHPSGYPYPHLINVIDSLYLSPHHSELLECLPTHYIGEEFRLSPQCMDDFRFSDVT